MQAHRRYFSTDESNGADQIVVGKIEGGFVAAPLTIQAALVSDFIIMFRAINVSACMILHLVQMSLFLRC